MSEHQETPALSEYRLDRAAVEAVRAACLDAARQAYEDASMQGLCAEGCWEAAVGAVRALDLQAVVIRAMDERSRE